MAEGLQKMQRERTGRITQRWRGASLQSRARAAKASGAVPC